MTERNIQAEKQLCKDAAKILEAWWPGNYKAKFIGSRGNTEIDPHPYAVTLARQTLAGNVFI